MVQQESSDESCNSSSSLEALSLKIVSTMRNDNPTGVIIVDCRAAVNTTMLKMAIVAIPRDGIPDELCSLSTALRC